MKLGIIGSGMIVHDFLTTADQVANMTVTAISSTKRSENIPMNQNPDEIILEKAVKGADGKYYQPITYRYGDKFIRNDFGGHLFLDGSTLGSHYNAGRIINGRYVGNKLHFFYRKWFICIINILILNLIRGKI